jgi:hypothetical protein
MRRGTTVFAAFLTIVTAAPSFALAQDVPDDFVITLERTIQSCDAECPAYVVTVDAQGNVTYDGKMYVRVLGPAIDRISVSRVRALAASVERIGFFKLNDRYAEIRNPDGSTSFVDHYHQSFVTVRRNGESKRIEASQGVPAGLTDLERQIDDTARTQRWIRIDVPTLRQLVAEGHPPTPDQRAEFLRLAIYADEADVVRALLEIGADPHALHDESNTPPLTIVRSGAAARAVIDAGADPLVRTPHGTTPIGWAASQQPDLTEALLKAGVPADLHIDRDGTTALISAAGHGNIGVVRLLLAAGADPRVRGRGPTALEAAQHGKEGAAKPPGGFSDRRRPPFVQDFDAVIAVLKQALAAKPR